MATSSELVTKPLTKDITNNTETPYGYCHCGCGQKTRPWPQNDTKRKGIKGEPKKFIQGHHNALARPASRIVIVDGVRCRTIPLTRGQEAIVDICDYDRLAKFRWYATLTASGWYAERTVRLEKGCQGKKIAIQMHNEVLRVRPGFEVDHANHNGLDNRRLNLRPATRGQQCHNMRKPSHNTSGYKGVSWEKRREVWQVAIKLHGKRIFLGYFPKNQLEIAARAYDQAAIDLFGNFACLNFPDIKE